MNPGLLVVVSGPAGVGKGTVVSRAREKNGDIVFSVSVTSRLPRPGEKDGQNYFFVTRERFEEMIRNGELLEWVEYCGNYYGTPKAYVEQELSKGNVVLLEIEVEGANNVKKMYPDCITVFITPPSLEELRRRLEKRGTEPPDVIEKRMKRAVEEMKRLDKYDYVINNISVEESARQLLDIIEKERKRTKI
ncbi:guanylate kinase Gmk [Thermoclostridium stercorarium subsp. stercorarium DSM 8532]|jgi:guanylate kinase|uniref:Guanylate kinase n=3 Tax=Thermoclostridium stercorarium TaxID=1510 RepID=L7VRH4_THES1|nr:guanylate kinase [Thermoclostridium stercorarium]AGC68996.1 guanylate kinase Gmk [Thermoclostridium stercorarium subsp. stercorarium DSM 8532]AGI39975.1 guanylate kinase [Thermoclostridium stercorarium subsp. stercorarium DSM 8532]ANW99295.1 guanylate kinase [Thermoclostridium stercorarium subsp. thermolacticum DSM 2910]ANX01924.1 guanylate kinase [Thermoclostridium stercorarium subsp. leptospartum DSM 9219]UZQ84966.1 guanylate kinase [Thermoclostridium stercorarium]